MKNKTISRPVDPQRPYDHISKRGVHYWFAPEWIRGTDSTNTKFSRIKPVKEKSGHINLYMVNMNGGITFIQGSIQREFRKWHEDRKIDYFFLTDDEDELNEIVLQTTLD